MNTPSTTGGTLEVSVTGESSGIGPDLAQWTFWWEFNKDPILNVKSGIYRPSTITGSDGFFLGRGATEEARDSLRPTERQIRETIVPALLAALETETNNDIVTGAIVALAKIGDVVFTDSAPVLGQVIGAFLSDANQEIRETAAVSLGILADERSIPMLTALLEDSVEGRRASKAGEVHYRTRAFSAYGLGLIGAATASESTRQKVVEVLARTIDNERTRSRDLKVACIIAMGLVPLETMEAASAGDEVPQAPQSSRVAQLAFLFDFMVDESHHTLVRAHCPVALARLSRGLASESVSVWRTRITETLTRYVDRGSRAKNEIVQSSVLALGLLGTNGNADWELRAVLARAPKEVSDQQARNFSMIATAMAASNPGGDGAQKGIAYASSFLVRQLVKGNTVTKPWAALGMGLMGRGLGERNPGSDGVVANLGEVLRSELEQTKTPERVGAYAIALGIMGDTGATERLIELLGDVHDDEACGYVAVALGMLNERSAIEPIQSIVVHSRYRPLLLRQTAIALGLLGDKHVVGALVDMLASAKGLATQASISSALGFIGDQESIAPLIKMLEDDKLTPLARGFAAVALGIVADKELLPWTSSIAQNLNYRASTPTLVDFANGTGVLDIL